MSLFEGIDRIGEEVRREIERALRSITDRFMYTEAGYRRAFVDLEETDEEYIARIEAPGVQRDKIEVKVEGRTLEVKADFPAEGEKRYVVKERGGRGFYRKVDLPSEVKPEEAKAYYRDGILEVRIPKARPTLRRRIPVE